MALTKVFVSSTCYDLSVLRAELRNFIKSLGHEPVMSDYTDILYDPRIHTHTSCVSEVVNCDMMIVIIGSRFGGAGVPQAIEEIDFKRLEKESNSSIDFEKTKVSITQLEVFKAIESNIPIYAFVDKKVYYEHEIYEKNKDNEEVIKNIIFPAIDKQDTAKYIFDFLNFIRLKKTGNSIYQFERLQDIEETLKKQWSGYFQKLLLEQRNREEEHKQINVLNEKFEDLKAAILGTMQNDQREVANGIVRYRKLSEFLFGLRCDIGFITSFKGGLDELIKNIGVIDIVDMNDYIPLDRERVLYPRTAFILSNETFYESKLSKDFYYDLRNEWHIFKELSDESKKLILATLREIGKPGLLLRYRNENFWEYCDKIIRKSVHRENIKDKDKNDE